jgi:hypothetical protein
LDPKVQKKCKRAKVLLFLFLFSLDPNRPLQKLSGPTVDGFAKDPRPRAGEAVMAAYLQIDQSVLI